MNNFEVKGTKGWQREESAAPLEMEGGYNSFYLYFS